ncbi:MAG: hypothetical protein H6573_07730 [Lewinellaceae bacterium]|nr:hypothetical protein [Phaeodactylibacter sp.]MCB0614450.1 hypothetical protein [Phaeodactylibacter sp.]MCB9347392.1 hypothetical protein [Lewinellaceae bacterium]
MIISFLIGIGGMIFLMAAWVIIQSLWRKSFSDYLSDEDVLADRSSCGNCGCTTACENKRLSTEKNITI